MIGEKCFLIEGKELFLKTILVEYDFVPLFYICVDKNNHYYTVLRRNLEEETYIIVQNKKEHIAQMLKNEITMRRLMMSEQKYWEVTAGEDISTDMVERKQLSDMPIKDLPFKNAKYGKPTAESEQLLQELNFNLSTNDSPVYDIIYDVIRNQYNSKEMGENIRKYVEMIYNQNLLQEYELSKLGYVQKNPIITEMSSRNNNKSEKTVCVNEFINFAA